MQSKAVVCRQAGEVQVEWIETPDPTPDEVVVRIEKSWISNGTEGSMVRGERVGGDTPWREGDPLPFPFVPGYQKVGIVEQCGARVSHVKPGDRVFAAASRFDDMFFSWGGHASPSVVLGQNVWKIPDNLPSEAFSGLVLTQVGVNIGLRAPIAAEEHAVVIGDGMVGNWAAQTLQHRGARVLLVGRHADRLDRFEGETLLLRDERDLADTVRGWAPEGLRLIAHTAGSLGSVRALMPQLLRFGQIVTAGFVGTEGLFDVQTLRDQELSLHAVAGWVSERMRITLDLVASESVKTMPLITHRFSVDDAPEAFRRMLGREPGMLGVILEWK